MPVVERLVLTVTERVRLVVGQCVGEREPEVVRLVETLPEAQRLGETVPEVVAVKQSVGVMVRLCVLHCDCEGLMVRLGVPVVLREVVGVAELQDDWEGDRVALLQGVEEVLAEGEKDRELVGEVEVLRHSEGELDTVEDVLKLAEPLEVEDTEAVKHSVGEVVAVVLLERQSVGLGDMLRVPLME